MFKITKTPASLQPKCKLPCDESHQVCSHSVICSYAVTLYAVTSSFIPLYFSSVSPAVVCSSVWTTTLFTSTHFGCPSLASANNQSPAPPQPDLWPTGNPICAPPPVSCAFRSAEKAFKVSAPAEARPNIVCCVCVCVQFLPCFLLLRARRREMSALYRFYFRGLRPVCKYGAVMTLRKLRGRRHMTK